MTELDSQRELSFESWAEVSASLLGIGHEARDETLARQGLSAAVWEREDARWSRWLVQEAALGRFEPIARYRVLCRSELERRDGAAVQTAPPIHAAGPPCPEEPSEPRLAPGQPPIAVTAPLPDLAATADVQVERLREPPLPFVPGDPESFLAAIPAALPLRATDSLHETAPERFSVVQKQALPWDPPFPRAPGALERYAVLCAHLAKAPNQQDAILAEHGIPGEGALRRLHLSFAEHFQAHPSDGQRWRMLVTRCRASPADR